MNKKDIKKQIKHQIESHIPQQPPKMDWSFIASERDRSQKEHMVSKRSFGYFKLALSTVFTLMIAVSLYMLFDGFKEPQSQPSGIELFESEQEVLPLSFLSTAALLPTQTQLSVSNNKALSTTSSPVEPLKPFLGLIEMIFSNSEGPQVEVLVSDLDQYETRVILHTFDLLGLPITYQMYYNVVQFNEADDEQTFIIEGIMKSQFMSYPMKGIKEVEDGEEKITVRSEINETSSIETVYQKEDNESKYRIKQIENNVTIYESKLKVEVEEDEIKIKMEIESASEESTYEMSYEIEDNKNLVKINFETYSFIDQIETSGEIKVYVMIDELSQISSYQFNVKTENDEYTEDYERDVKHDEDDDDEDDDEDDEDNEDDQKDDEEDEDETDDEN